MNDKQARILIVGGGFGGLFTALGLAGAGEVTLISTEEHFLLTPMLYEYLSGEVEAWHIAPTYKELLDDNVRFVHGLVTDVDLRGREVGIEGRTRRMNYDALVLAVGGVTNFAGVEGAEQHALPFRTLADADLIRRRMVESLDRIPPDADPQDARRAATFVIVGAGASGVELATKMSDLLFDAFARRGLKGEPRLVVVEMADRVVPGMGEELREYVTDALRTAHIEVHTHTRVLSVTPMGIRFEHESEQTELEAAAVIWTGGVKPSPLVEKLDVPKNKRGLVTVEPTLQVLAHKEVFSLGDDASGAHVSPRLAGTAQLAYQQASLCAQNVRAFLHGEKLTSREFVEQGEALSLGTENAAVLTGDKTFGGVLARQARFALYTSRLPTWHHRLKVGASWFLQGTKPRPLVADDIRVR